MYERDDPSSINVFAVFVISPLLTEVTAVFRIIGFGWLWHEVTVLYSEGHEYKVSFWLTPFSELWQAKLDGRVGVVVGSPCCVFPEAGAAWILTDAGGELNDDWRPEAPWSVVWWGCRQTEHLNCDWHWVVAWPPLRQLKHSYLDLTAEILSRIESSHWNVLWVLVGPQKRHGTFFGLLNCLNFFDLDWSEGVTAAGSAVAVPGGTVSLKTLLKGRTLGIGGFGGGGGLGLRGWLLLLI